VFAKSEAASLVTVNIDIHLSEEFVMTELSMSRRASLRNIAALGAATAAVAIGATALTTAPAEAIQVHMDIALATLKIALNQLNAAAADKGGFRVKALAEVTQAIADVQSGIAYAKAHP
jgi:flagellar biosynthesis protein FlhB